MEPTSKADPPFNSLTAVRCALGGTLMGLANLVPGISGGTMLLAAGVYPRFINAIGRLSTLKLKRDPLLTVAAVALAAILAIALLAGPVKDLVVHHRWIMYSLFIGLTLGGVPVIWRLIGKASPAVYIAAVIGFVAMAALAMAQANNPTAAQNDGPLFMLLAGVAGASAMILPGISGGYLFLVLGVYVPILAAISAFVDALKTFDTGTLLSIGFATLLPVAIGVLLGIAAVSNLLRYLLNHYEKATLGVLLGLLLGAVVGLYPFVEPVPPKPGDRLKNQTVILDPTADATNQLIFEQTGRPVEPDDFPTATFTPTPIQIFSSLGLILLGLAATTAIDRFGREKPIPPQSRSTPNPETQS
ncbi:DUF368 domain-containing protein [Mucisphaera sp.]|uniref:DUF368 domain-containing protein n=1 Tax=Mucisphaera sp. TaxID=2913024 RepID=UPI003D09E05D